MASARYYPSRHLARRFPSRLLVRAYQPCLLSSNPCPALPFQAIPAPFQAIPLSLSLSLPDRRTGGDASQVRPCPPTPIDLDYPAQYATCHGRCCVTASGVREWMDRSAGLRFRRPPSPLLLVLLSPNYLYAGSRPHDIIGLYRKHKTLNPNPTARQPNSFRCSRHQVAGRRPDLPGAHDGGGGVVSGEVGFFN